MASVNRYTQLSSAQFDPMSLEEIMMVPMYKQQQHNKLDEERALLAKTFQVDPLPQHKDEAMRLKQEFEANLDSQASELAKYGLNQNSRSQFLKTKREYDNLLSPTGRVGQINAAKKVYYDNMKEYLDDATKTKGWSREVALANWQNKHANSYTGYNPDDNSITNIGNYGAPKKIETMEKLKQAKDLLGEQVVNEMKASGYKLMPQSDGSMVMADSKGRRIETSNKPNLQNALSLLNEQINAPEWSNSIAFEGTDPSSVKNQVVYGINSMLDTKVTDNRTTDYSMHGYENANKDKEDTSMDLLTNTEVFNPSAYATSSYGDNQSALETLSNKPNLTPAENVKLTQLKTFQQEINKTLESNPRFRKLNNDKENIKTKLGIKFDPSKVEEVDEVVDAGGMGTTEKRFYLNNKPMSPADVSKYQQYIKKNNSVENEIRSMQNKASKENNVKYNGYQLVPITSKDNTSINLMNATFEDAMKANPMNLANLTNIEGVDIDGKRIDKMSNRDRLEISKLFSNTDRGNTRIVSFIPKGFSGKPEYIVEFTTKEGQTYNMDGLKMGDDDLGDGKPVRLRLSFNKSSGDVLKNVNGYVQTYLSDKGNVNPTTGRKEGYDLALEMNNNAVKSNMNEQLGSSKWVDYVTSETDFSQLPPLVTKQLQKELKRYGLTNDTTDEQLEGMVKTFLKQNGNRNIYLE